jgi:hypothetical protein
VYAYFDVLKFKQDTQVRNYRALKFHVMILSHLCPEMGYTTE